MKIRKLQLKNIGVFDDETIEFQPCPVKDKAEIHIFTGQNGSGKTTIVQGLASIFNSYLSIDPWQRYPTGLIWGNDINSFSKRFHHVFEESPHLNSYLVAFAELQNKHQPNFKTVIFADPQTGQITSNDEIGDINNYRTSVKNYNNEDLNFAVFAYSAYRQIQSEPVQALKEAKNFNPLNQSLEFVKNYDQEDQISINQLIANNISNRALSKEDGSLEESKKYEAVINEIEIFIKNVTNYEVKFILKRSPNELKLKIHGEELDFDVLPDGLRSLISWIADLLGRVDLLKWQNDLPINEKNLILLLDEIEVHLHPAWQRKILPVVQKLFKNSQIFVSTHSPFVVNSIDDAWVYKLELENGKAKVTEIVKSEDAWSYSRVLSEIFDIDEEFGIGVQKDLAKFKELRNKIIAGKNGTDKTQKDFLQLAKNLAVQSEELQTIIQFELRQLNNRTGKNLTI